MELRVLRYFLSIVEEGGIAAAAEALHVTQPTISRQIAALEETLGTELFFHDKRPLTLTPEGRIFFQRAQDIVELADKTEQEFKKIALQDLTGTIGIGLVESLGAMILPMVIGKSYMNHPGVQYQIYTGYADDIKNRLDYGLLDVGVLVEPVDYTKYETLPLPLDDPWGVLMLATNPLANHTSVSIDELMDAPLIVPQRVVNPSYKSSWLSNAIKGAKIVATYNILSNAALLAQSGIGYAICHFGGALPRMNDKLVFVPLAPLQKSRSVLVWKRDRLFSPAMEMFLEEFRNTLASEILI